MTTTNWILLIRFQVIGRHIAWWRPIGSRTVSTGGKQVVASQQPDGRIPRRKRSLQRYCCCNTILSLRLSRQQLAKRPREARHTQRAWHTIYQRHLTLFVRNDLVNSTLAYRTMKFLKVTPWRECLLIELLSFPTGIWTMSYNNLTVGQYASQSTSHRRCVRLDYLWQQTFF